MRSQTDIFNQFPLGFLYYKIPLCPILKYLPTLFSCSGTKRYTPLEETIHNKLHFAEGHKWTNREEVMLRLDTVL